MEIDQGTSTTQGPGGGGGSSEESVGVRNFLAARIKEINSLTNQICTTGVPSSKGLAFQHVPKHMRRRAVSHNPKRLPKRLQGAHVSQVEKSSGSSGVNKKPKKPSRKYRRRPSNLLQEYNRRQRTNKWVETHVWHAKRFHMQNKWGYRIPYSPTDKGYRAGYRAATQHCVMRDISFYSCLKLEGNPELIKSTFSNFTPPQANPLSMGAEMFKNGKREGTLHFYEAGRYPFQYIGKVRFFWEAGGGPSLVIWVHPEQKEQIIRELCSAFELMYLKSGTTTTTGAHQEESIEMEVCEPSEILHGVKDEKLVPKNLMTRPRWINHSINVKMTDLEGVFNRFRIYGPLSTATLKDTLEGLSPMKVNESEGSNFQNWWIKYYSNKLEVLEKQNRLWAALEGFDQVPCNSILPFTVRDPRISIPRRKQPSSTNVLLRETGMEGEEKPDCSSLVDDLQEFSCNSPIFYGDVLTEVVNQRMSQQEFTKSRGQLFIPGSKLELGTDENYVPIVLIHRPNSNSQGFSDGGWDLIMPAGWAMPFWIALVYRSVRVVGHREAETFEFESGVPLSSNEDGTLPPDSLAGEAESKLQSADLQATYFKYPPSKRSNFTKLRCPYPFFIDWKELLDFNKRNMEDPSNEPVDKFHVCRDLSVLRMLHRSILQPKSDIPLSLNNVSFSNSCLVNVRITIFGKGSIDPGAVICIPSKSDIVNVPNESDSLLEPIGDDSDSQMKRVEFKNQREKLKSFLQSKRRKLRKRQRNGEQVDISQFSHDKVDFINDAINALWLPNSQQTLEGLSRTPIGFCVLGRETYSIAKCSGLGYCTLNGLFQWIKSSVMSDWNPHKLVLVRNCRNTLVYRWINKVICLNELPQRLRPQFLINIPTRMATPLWLDCDPGHDDAFAILLAAYSPEVELLGISIVGGNDTVEHCALNAKRFLWACGIKGIPVYHGVNHPIVRQPKHCPEIHGVPGEDGVAGMCGYHFPDEEIFSDPSNLPEKGHGVLKMVEIVKSHPEKVTVVMIGAQTNVALAIRMFPEIKENIEKFVFMGGAVGLGNTGIAAEFNIETDPEAAHVVFQSGIPLVMMPLEVTHSILITPTILELIANVSVYTSASPLSPEGVGVEKKREQRSHRHVEYEELFRRIKDATGQIENENENENEIPKCSSSSRFAECCVQLLSFFQSTYKSVFGFNFPPLHDPSAIYYCINPKAFKSVEMFLDVELSSTKSLGRTLCDIHGISKRSTNATVCYEIDVVQFWQKMLVCLNMANKNSPLNERK